MQTLHEMSEVIYIGQVAVFYIPVQKLDSFEYLPEVTPRMIFEKYLMEHFNAFSFRISDTQGFWREHHKSKIFVDENARYEVSFLGEEAVVKFVRFLSAMCALIEEEAIYLVMGYKSWLIKPLQGDRDVIRRKIQGFQGL